MPDPTSPATQTSEDTQPAGDGWRPDLGALRARLDEIDDTIHDLLMDRALVIEGVARSGKTAAFRPGREASILRRLLGRHTGRLPARTLVRMWREMLAGTTAMQSPVTLAVFDPTPDGAVNAIAREHFGFLTPAVTHPTIEATLNAARTGAATVAVLPFPLEDATWRALIQTASDQNGSRQKGLRQNEPHQNGPRQNGPRLYVIARLPFWAGRPCDVPAADAVVIATTAPDASGETSGADRTFLALSQTPDRARLADAGLTLHATHGPIAEIEGMVSQNDPRLTPLGFVTVLGGYAVPVAGDNA